LRTGVHDANGLEEKLVHAREGAHSETAGRRSGFLEVPSRIGSVIEKTEAKSGVFRVFYLGTAPTMDTEAYHDGDGR